MSVALQGEVQVQGQPLEMPLRPSGKEWWEEWCPKVTVNMFFDIWHQLQAQVGESAAQQSCGPLPLSASLTRCRARWGPACNSAFQGHVANSCPAFDVGLFLL